MKLKMPGGIGWGLAIVCGGIAVALPYLFHVEHHRGFWESIPGWWALFGAVGCAAIILVSKWLGAALLQKPEDWYDRD